MKVDYIYACFHEMGVGRVKDVTILKEWLIRPTNGSFNIQFDVALARPARAYRIYAMQRNQAGKHVTVAQLSGPSFELLSAGSTLKLPVLSR